MRFIVSRVEKADKAGCVSDVPGDPSPLSVEALQASGEESNREDELLRLVRAHVAHRRTLVTIDVRGQVPRAE